MVILRREEFSSSELNVEDVNLTHSDRVVPRTSSLWGGCSNSWLIMQGEDKSHPSSNEQMNPNCMEMPAFISYCSSIFPMEEVFT